MTALASNRNVFLSLEAIIPAFALLAILALTWLVYIPGLSGNYLFDDFSNLNALGASGPVDHWPSLLRYITSGVGDPTGRPLPLLSFLIDAQDWPADPYSFKRTNVLLHLINGALLCWVLLTLGRRFGLSESRSSIAAVLGASIWLLHPLFVSTTLYIVQREAMLPATFTFIGILCWCRGRSQLSSNRTLRSWFWMATGAWACTLFAVLCKANGALLPLFIVAAELTILRNDKVPNASIKSSKYSRLILLAAPVTLIALIMLAELPGAIDVAREIRPWTITQRLLSEPRVLIDYLHLLWIPRSTSFGVFNDQIIASSDLWHPWTTLPALIVIVMLVGFGWVSRKRYPIIAFAILFYFFGQLIESTFLPLELGFEHRNYLPAAVMFWPLAIFISRNGIKPLSACLSMLIFFVLSGLTWERSQVWGDLQVQALVWGKINPDSARAQAFAAAVEMDSHHDQQAITRLRIAMEKMPDEVQITLNLAMGECRVGQVTSATWSYVLHSLQHTTNTSRAVFDWFLNAISKAERNECKGLAFKEMDDALQSLRANPKFNHESGRRQDVFHIAGELALAEGQLGAATENFDSALANAPDRGTPLAQAAAFGNAGQPQLGLNHLMFADDHAVYTTPPFGMPRIHAWVLNSQDYWGHETTHLRNALASDAEARLEKKAQTSP